MKAQPITTGGNTCKDNLDNCAQLGQLFCSGQYLDFAKQNCQKYCNLCPGSPGAVATPKPSATVHSEFCNYKNKKYKQGESWRDGCQYNCTCEDASVGYYTCRNLCPQYINLPPGCSLTTRYGECCAIPFCVPTMTPSIVPRSNNTCYFNGTAYAQGQKWNDGCRQSCTCADDSSGCFSCRAICLNWSQLPSTCRMEPVPPGLCCQQPRCPPWIILKIPSAYMDQYPGYTYV